jgi:cysteine desulfurase
VRALASLLGPDVALVSVMALNNEIGTTQPIAEVARLAHGAGALMHCDAVQAAGKLALDVHALDVDLLSIAGHKFEGPQGGAALFVRRRVRLLPLIAGGHQERSRRAGTENLPAIVGLGAAAARAGRWLASTGPAALAAHGERLARLLRARVPGSRVNADGPQRHPAIVNLCIEGVDGEAVLHELDRAGVTVSTGSACSAATPGPSHVLLAIGCSAEDAHASVRFSLGPDTTEDDIQHIADVTPGIVERLRSLDSNSAQHSA